MGTLNQAYTHAATWRRIRLSPKNDKPLDRHMKKSTAYGFLPPIREGIVEDEREVWLCLKSANLHLIQVNAYGEEAMRSEEQSHLLAVVMALRLWAPLWCPHLP